MITRYTSICVYHFLVECRFLLSFSYFPLILYNVLSPFLCFHPMSCHPLLSFRGWSLDDSEELLQVPSDALQPLTAVPLESEVWVAGVGRHVGHIWKYIFLSF